jgi:hypothetical protein
MYIFLLFRNYFRKENMGWITAVIVIGGCFCILYVMYGHNRCISKPAITTGNNCGADHNFAGGDKFNNSDGNSGLPNVNDNKHLSPGSSS